MPDRKTAKKAPARRKPNLRIRVTTPRERELEDQVRQLQGRITDLAEHLKWRDEARDGYKRGMDALEAENKRLREQVQRDGEARYEAARLSGVIEGMERRPVQIDVHRGMHGDFVADGPIRR